MSTRVLYHGSQKIIGVPQFGSGKPYNDYGLGFYCTESVELAKEWACPELNDGFANRSELDTDGLTVLNLRDGQYTALHWLSLLVMHRRFDLDTPLVRQDAARLRERFLPGISAVDAITGWRADDSYFSFARAFLSNQISYAQLRLAMRPGKLGEQFVLKSPRAFSTIRFTGYERADAAVYYQVRRRRAEQASADYRASLAEDDLSGLFMRDIIVQGVTPDDPRLR